MSIARSLPIALAAISLLLVACGPSTTGGGDTSVGPVDANDGNTDAGGGDAGPATDAAGPADADGVPDDAGGGDTAPTSDAGDDAGSPEDAGLGTGDAGDDVAAVDGDDGGPAVQDGGEADATVADATVEDGAAVPDAVTDDASGDPDSSGGGTDDATGEDAGPAEDVMLPEGPPDVADECDKDEDQVLAAICGGTDCLDWNANAYPGAPDTGEPSCNTAASWTTEIVPGSESETAMYTSVSIDWAGDIHVTWYSLENQRLMYATDRTGLWITVVIDDAGDAGWYSSSAVDDLGFVHISYHDKGGGLLKYATDTSGDWVIEILDGPAPGVGTFTSLAVDQTGRPHIAYHDGQNGLVRYARLEADGWQTQSVAAQGLLRPHISLAVMPNGAPSIMFRDDQQDAINRVYGVNGFWKLDTLNAGEAMGYFPSHGLLPNGDYRAAFYQCIQFIGSACWTTHLVFASGSPGGEPQLGAVAQQIKEFTPVDVVVDSVGATHIAYPDNELMYARVAGFGGLPTQYDIDEEVLAPGEQVSIAAGQDGRLAVSWRDDKADAVRIGRSTVCSGVDQSCKGIDSFDTDGDGSVDSAFGGPDCNDALDWIKPGAADAEAADCEDPTSYQALSIGPNGGAGWVEDASLAIGPEGTGYIASYDPDGKLVLYSHELDAGTWSPLTIDASAGVGPGTAIAADRDGDVHVVYRHGASNGLRYATNTGGAWGLQLIPATGSPGFDPAIAIDIAGNVHVAHYNSGVQGLGYATNKGGTWSSITVETGFPAGRNPAIAVHPIGDVWMLYHWSSPVDADLRLATNASGQFESFPISAADTTPQGLGLQIDRTGVVHVLYMEGGSLQYGAFSTVEGTWTFETAWTNPTGNAVMGQLSFILDDVDRLWVVVGDEAEGLWLLHRRPNGWESMKVHETWGVSPDIGIDLMGNVQIIGRGSLPPATDTKLGWLYGTSCAIADHDCDGFDL